MLFQTVLLDPLITRYGALVEGQPIVAVVGNFDLALPQLVLGLAQIRLVLVIWDVLQSSQKRLRK